MSKKYETIDRMIEYYFGLDILPDASFDRMHMSCSISAWHDAHPLDLDAINRAITHATADDESDSSHGHGWSLIHDISRMCHCRPGGTFLPRYAKT